MAGSDQSRNLGGMLSQIGTTLSSTGLGSAFKDLMINTQAPRVDPNDLASITRAADYASRTGNEQQAAIYMAQARELRADQKEQRSMDNMAGTDKATMTGNLTAQQIAASGDVTNLDRSIAALRERLQGDFPSVQARNYAKQNLERLESMRAGAVDQQTQNHAKAVSDIDAALADPSINPAAQGALTQRKEELLKNPDVQKALTAQKLDAFRAQKAQEEMESAAYLEKNMPALREAVNDPKAAQEIIAGAPPSAQIAVQQAYNTMREFQTGLDEVRTNFDAVATPSNFDLLSEQIEQIPEELRAGATQAVEFLREAESFRDKDGRPLTEGHAIRIANARSKVTGALVAAQNMMGQQEYSARRAQERKEEDEIAELEIARDTFRPSDIDVERRAEQLAKEAGATLQIGAQPKKGSRRATAGRTVYDIGGFLDTARAQLMEEHRFDSNREIARRKGETAELDDIIIGTYKYTGERDPFSGEPLPEQFDDKSNWEELLPGIEVPERKQRKTYVEKPHIYDESFITKLVRGDD